MSVDHLAATEPMILVTGVDVIALRDVPPVQYELSMLQVEGEPTPQPVWVADGPMAVGFRHLDDIEQIWMDNTTPAVVWTVTQNSKARCFTRYVVPIHAIDDLPGGYDRFVEQANLPFHKMDQSYLLCVMRLAIEERRFAGDTEPCYQKSATEKWRLAAMVDSFMFNTGRARSTPKQRRKRLSRVL